MRIDLFLKLSGLVKTRSIAEKACDAGAVTINGRAAKSASRIGPGSVVSLARPDGGIITISVNEVPQSKSVSRADRARLYSVLDGDVEC